MDYKRVNVTKEFFASMSMDTLVSLWEATARTNDHSSKVYIIRGWCLDEFEDRNFEGFSAWINSEDCDDFKLREYML